MFFGFVAQVGQTVDKLVQVADVEAVEVGKLVARVKGLVEILGDLKTAVPFDECFPPKVGVFQVEDDFVRLFQVVLDPIFVVHGLSRLKIINGIGKFKQESIWMPRSGFVWFANEAQS